MGSEMCIRDSLYSIISAVASMISGVFSCGPSGMLKEISSICDKFSLRAQISLECKMACGVGLCQGCAVKVKNPSEGFEYKLVCKDGPVFYSDAVIWED